MEKGKIFCGDVGREIPIRECFPSKSSSVCPQCPKFKYTKFYRKTLIKHSAIKSEKTKFEFDSTDYNCMDDMPLKGWAWEFMRRSSKYKKLLEVKDYAEFIKGVENIEIYPIKFTVRDNRLEVYKKYCFGFIYIVPGEVHSASINKKGETIITRKKKGYFEEFIGLPLPQYRYTDFPEEIQLYFNIILREEIRRFSFEFFKSITERVRQGAILRLLSPNNDPENTIFIGISRTGKIQRIREEIDLILKEYVKTAPIKERKDDKWKYYLIVFDMVQEGISYTDIITELKKAYPKHKRLFTKKNIGNYHKNAVDLNEGSYKKFLINTP